MFDKLFAASQTVRQELSRLRDAAISFIVAQLWKALSVEIHQCGDVFDAEAMACTHSTT